MYMRMVKVLKKVGHSITNLPQNIKTIRPFFEMNYNPWAWGLGLAVNLQLQPPHDIDTYLFHFDILTIQLVLGPFDMWCGLEDSN